MAPRVISSSSRKRWTPTGQRTIIEWQPAIFSIWKRRFQGRIRVFIATTFSWECGATLRKILITNVTACIPSLTIVVALVLEVLVLAAVRLWIGADSWWTLERWEVVKVLKITTIVLVSKRAFPSPVAVPGEVIFRRRR
jgi:hypothetical protein